MPQASEAPTTSATQNEEQENFVNSHMEDQEVFKFFNNFCIIASIQGRVAYLLMSVHAVNPYIMKNITGLDPRDYLFSSMVYGGTIMLFCRPSMRAISTFNRTAFSILGSLMFNYSTMLVYDWLVKKFSHRIYILTFLGFLSGRLMMQHLLAYLYHVDSRYRGFRIRPNPEYESIYRYFS